MATEHDHLAQTIRHITRAEEMVMAQRGLIDRMVQHGHDTHWCSTMLRSFESVRRLNRLTTKKFKPDLWEAQETPPSGRSGVLKPAATPGEETRLRVRPFIPAKVSVSCDDCV